MREERGLTRRGVFAIAVCAIVSQAWILTLPFQLDDFLLVADPWALFGHVEEYRDADIPPFMMRVPMWLAWAFVHLFATEPLSPVPFHVFGLVLHTTVALLLARLVARHARMPLAGALAGCFFGVAAGAMQAVSWTAAWSSLLYTLFGVLGLGLMLDARDAKSRGAWIRRSLGALCFYLAIITKAPAIVVPVAAFVVVALTARAWKRIAAETLVFAVAVGAGLVSRTLFLGTRHLRYEEKVTPSVGEAFAMLPGGFQAFGQALYPWNRDPLFLGEEPLFALLGWPPWWIAALVCGGVVALALGFARPWRKPLAVCLLALGPCILPPAVLYDGSVTNVFSRTAYLPMAAAMAGLGIACAALLRERLWLGAVGLGFLAVFLIDGNRHVAHTERLHGDELRAIRALLDGLANEQERERPGRELLLFAIVPDAGFAGMPSMGPYLARSHAPPFTEERRLEIRTFVDAQQMRAAIAELDLTDRDVCFLGPELDADWNPVPPEDGTSGQANRARRLPRLAAPIRPALQGPPPVFALQGDAWVASSPVPAHALGAFELDVESGAAVKGTFRVEQDGRSWPLALSDPGGDERRVGVEFPRALPFRFGAPVERIVWEGAGQPPAAELRVRASLPELTAVAPREGETFVADPEATEGPAFRLRRPDALRGGWRGTAFARLELVFTLKAQSVTLYSDFPVAPELGVIELVPHFVHLLGDAPTLVDPASGAPWNQLVRDRILPVLAGGELTSATFAWRVTLHHEGGAPAARSRTRTARYVPR